MLDIFRAPIQVVIGLLYGILFGIVLWILPLKTKYIVSSYKCNVWFAFALSCADALFACST